jgi:nitrate reductase beta subunit
MLQDRQTADTLAGPAGKASRVNLLNWDGKGAPTGLFPPRSGGPGPVDPGVAPDTHGTGETDAGGTGGLTGGADLR